MRYKIFNAYDITLFGKSGDGQNLIDIDLNIKNGNLKQIKEILRPPAFERVDAGTCWILTAWKRRDSFHNITKNINMLQKNLYFFSNSKSIRYSRTCFKTKKSFFKPIFSQVPETKKC